MEHLEVLLSSLLGQSHSEFLVGLGKFLESGLHLILVSDKLINPLLLLLKLFNFRDLGFQLNLTLDLLFIELLVIAFFHLLKLHLLLFDQHVLAGDHFLLEIIVVFLFLLQLLYFSHVLFIDP